MEALHPDVKGILLGEDEIRDIVSRMGKEIAFRLADEGHDITVVDDDEQNLETVSNSMDVMTLLGNGAQDIRA